MNIITVHRVKSEDITSIIPGIVNVFRDDEVAPWHRYEECLAWVTRRVNCGFYSTLAYDGDKITGFSEWIETYDNGKKILYLGTMQVDCDLRGRGIGGAMLADGEKYAKNIGAQCLRTIPEDERAHGFYLKYGFTETDSIYYCLCPTIERSIAAQPVSAAILTLDAANTNEFIFGLCQSSGRHMYEVANHNPDDSFMVITSNISGGYLQFRYQEGSKTALALYWGLSETTVETVSAILARGYENGFENVEFYFKSKHANLFAEYAVTRDNTELEREIVNE